MNQSHRQGASWAVTSDPSNPVSFPVDIPPRLARVVREAQGPLPDLSGLDDAVLVMARGRLGRRSPAMVIWRVGAALTAAAAVAVVAYFAWPGVAAPNLITLDRSRPVTILEAFRLARMLEGGSAGELSQTWDATGDGTVDGRDVEALAAEAVRLGSPSQREGAGGRASVDLTRDGARGGPA